MNGQILPLHKTAKSGKEYYGLFYCKDDVEVLMCFISKFQYDMLMQEK